MTPISHNVPTVNATVTGRSHGLHPHTLPADPDRQPPVTRPGMHQYRFGPIEFGGQYPEADEDDHPARPGQRNEDGAHDHDDEPDDADRDP